MKTYRANTTVYAKEALNMEFSEKELKAILEALTTAHRYLYKDWTSELEFPTLSEKEYNDLITRFENNIHSQSSNTSST
jgi:hypothetical protein